MSIDSISHTAIYPYPVRACFRNALSLVCALDGCAVVVVTRVPHLSGHAVCDTKGVFGGHAVVSAVEAQLNVLLVLRSEWIG